MSHDATIQAQAREKLGSRQARKLRADGRIPCSLQFDGEADQPIRHFHLPEAEFLAGRRHDVHLWDIEVGGETHSAVVRELQWGAMGDRLTHIDFKGVHRGQKTEVEVPITLFGQNPAVVNLIKSSIVVSCLPREIPDSVEIPVAELPIGTHLHAADLTLPEGSELGEGEAKENAMVLTIIEEVVQAEPVEDEDGEAADGEAAPEGGGDAGGEG